MVTDNITCPRCHTGDCKEIFRSKEDTIDNLDHAHIECNQCGYNFNHWHETEARLKEVYGDQWETYAKLTMGLA